MPEISLHARLSRRAFLQGALGAGLLAGTLPLAGCAAPPPAPAAPLAFLTPEEHALLAAVSGRLVPTSDRFGPGAVPLGVAARADALLARAPRAMQDDFRQLLAAFGLNARLFLGVPYARQPAAAQDAWLALWRGAPVPLLRQGYVAFERLCQMLFYVHPDAWAAIRYPGPWVGRIANAEPLPRPLNPHVFARGLA